MVWLVLVFYKRISSVISRSLMKVFWYLFFVYAHEIEEQKRTSTRCVIIETLFLHNVCDLLEAVCMCREVISNIL